MVKRQFKRRPTGGGIRIEAIAFDRQVVECWIIGRHVACPAGEVSRSVPLTVVLHQGKMRSAQAIAKNLKRLGFKARVVRRRRPDHRRSDRAEQNQPLVERPYCPACRERDRVVLPCDPNPPRKAWREPYCERCQSRLRTLPKHRLATPDFD